MDIEALLKDRALAVRAGWMIPLCAMLAAPAAPAAMATQPLSSSIREWHFKVLLDGRPIGEHDFVVRQNVGRVEVTTRAHFIAKVLILPIYRYDHEDHEIWRSGCLAQIDAHTNDNGVKSSVHGRLRGEAFEVHSGKGSAMLPTCVQSFAYWNRDSLAEHRLLNAQSGNFENVVVTHYGLATLLLGAQVIDAQHDSIESDHFKIDLWYSPSGQWLALRTRLGNGRTLRYELQ